MIFVICAALMGISSVSAQRCGAGTVFNEETNACEAKNLCGAGTYFDETSGTCVVASSVSRREAHGGVSKILSDDGNITFSLKDGKKVGVQVHGEDAIQYIDTAESTAQAVVEAINLGYSMNRELDTIKQLNAAKDSLNQQIDDLKTESADARTQLKNDVTKSQANAETKLNNALSAAQQNLDDGLKDAQDKVKKASDDSKAALDQFKKANEATIKANKEAVDGLKGAVPSFACNNKVKDGAETDVDCGGPCGPCAKGKKCKFTDDCDNSVCMGGTCKTCSQGNGAVTIAPGVNAVCKSGFLQPENNYPYLHFHSCGKTGEEPPTETDCNHINSFTPSRYSLHRDVEYKYGYQKFVAPVDGDYKWWVHGAAGGTDATCCRQYRTEYNRHGKGGQGGRVVATQQNVKAGTAFYIRVGQRGVDCWDTNDGIHNPAIQKYRHCIYNPSRHGHWDNGKQWYEPGYNHWGFNACGGFNGGGPAICNHDLGGASGGGATDIRMCKNGGDCDVLPDLAKRFIVGGGGGGGSCEGNDPHGCNHYSRWGGHGGGDSGEHGYSNGWSGYGGTQSAGGRGQWGNNRDHGNSEGVRGQGGTGGQNDGGGGGGGYFGGGGAHHNAGGGGGSNFRKGTSISGNLQVHNNDRGNNRNEGYVLLTIKTK